MVDPTTTNKFLSQPASGTDVGTWDTPVNGNMDIIDDSFGGVATIAFSSISSATYTLSSTQYRCAFLKFTGAIPSNIAVTLPAVGSLFTIINEVTNSSAFYLTMATTAAGGQAIGLPPGVMTDILSDATNVRFRGLPHVGTYWDHSGSSVPAWVSACTVPPWLYCNGQTFSSATYPALAALYGSTTTPDFRGRMSFNMNDGTGRVTSSQGGIDGNTIFAAGGIQTTSLSTVNLPNVNFTVTDPGHTHTHSNTAFGNSQGYNGGSPFATGAAYTPSGVTLTISNAVTGISVNSGGSNAAFAVTPPAAVGGIRLVRAA